MKMKWTKNAFRTLLVLICAFISICGGGNLDLFVALIGSVACVPLVYIYPAILHYKGVASSSAAKVGDIVFAVVGFFAMIYTTVITISSQ